LFHHKITKKIQNAFAALQAYTNNRLFVETVANALCQVSNGGNQVPISFKRQATRRSTANAGRVFSTSVNVAANHTEDPLALTCRFSVAYRIQR
jgi:hypothetical protein